MRPNAASRSGTSCVAFATTMGTGATNGAPRPPHSAETSTEPVCATSASAIVIAACEDSLGPLFDPPFVADALDQRMLCMAHADAIARSPGESCTKISPAGSSLKILEIAAALALKFAVVTHSVLLPVHSF